MKWNEHIVIDPAILTGKPVVRGSRLSVDFILSLLGEGWSSEEVQRNYPGIGRDAIAACQAYASEALASERIYPLIVAAV